MWPPGLRLSELAYWAVEPFDARIGVSAHTFGMPICADRARAPATRMHDERAPGAHADGGGAGVRLSGRAAVHGPGLEPRQRGGGHRMPPRHVRECLQLGPRHWLARVIIAGILVLVEQLLVGLVQHLGQLLHRLRAHLNTAHAITASIT